MVHLHPTAFQRKIFSVWEVLDNHIFRSLNGSLRDYPEQPLVPCKFAKFDKVMIAKVIPEQP